MSSTPSGAVVGEQPGDQVRRRAQLEETYHYVGKNRPELFNKSLAETESIVRAQLEAKALRDDIAARDKADQAQHRAIGTNQRTEGLDNIQALAPTGTSAERALRKLRKDAPELHARVLAKELSPHAAMVQAGYRPRTFTVRADSPEAVAAALRRQLSSEDLARVITLLVYGDALSS